MDASRKVPRGSGLSPELSGKAPGLRHFAGTLGESPRGFRVIRKTLLRRRRDAKLEAADLLATRKVDVLLTRATREVEC